MQEALANVAKHSSAHNVNISLRLGESLAEFCLSDDGVGFDTHHQHDGMGLDSMRERAESLRGVFSVQSEPGQGAKICISIPIE